MSNIQYGTGSASKKDIVIQRLDIALKSSLFVTHYNLLDEIFECEQLSFREFYQRCDISLLQRELPEEFQFL